MQEEKNEPKEWEGQVPDVVKEEADDKPAGRNILGVIIIALIVLAIIYYFFFRDSANMFQ